MQDSIILDKDDMTQNINLGIDCLLDSIINDGVISKEQADQIEMYKVMIAKDNIFGRITSKLFNKKDRTYKFIVVKLISDTPTEGNDE